MTSLDDELDQAFDEDIPFLVPETVWNYLSQPINPDDYFTGAPDEIMSECIDELRDECWDGDDFNAGDFCSALESLVVTLNRQKYWFVLSFWRHFSKARYLDAAVQNHPMNSDDALKMTLYTMVGSQMANPYTGLRLTYPESCDSLFDVYNDMPAELQTSAAEYLQRAVGNTLNVDEFREKK